MALLEAHGVSKVLGSSTVLRDVDLEVEAGAQLTITGRSGSGKSTLLKLLAGLDRPSSGTIRVDGTDLATLDDDALSEIRLRRIGLLFQSPMLLPDLTIRENVLLPLSLAGTPRARAEERVLELLRVVGVEHIAEKRPNAVSGGEAQRASIARSLANGPSLVFADEPTSGLDRANAENVLDLLHEINRELRTTIVIATHDPVAIERSQTRVHIEDGRVEQIAPLAHFTITKRP